MHRHKFNLLWISYALIALHLAALVCVMFRCKLSVLDDKRKYLLNQAIVRTIRNVSTNVCNLFVPPIHLCIAADDDDDDDEPKRLSELN